MYLWTYKFLSVTKLKFITLLKIRRVSDMKFSLYLFELRWWIKSLFDKISEIPVWISGSISPLLRYPR